MSESFSRIVRLSINNLVLHVKSLTGGSTEAPSTTRQLTSNVNKDKPKDNSVERGSTGRKRKIGGSDEGEDDDNNPNKKRKLDIVIYEGQKINLKKIEDIIRTLTIFQNNVSRLNVDGSFV